MASMVLHRRSRIGWYVHARPCPKHAVAIWLRTNGVDTNGATAKVINFDRLGKKVRPGTFGEDKSRLTGVPKRSVYQKKHDICSDPISADPIRPLSELCPAPMPGARGVIPWLAASGEYTNTTSCVVDDLTVRRLTAFRVTKLPKLLLSAGAVSGQVHSNGLRCRRSRCAIERSSFLTLCPSRKGKIICICQRVTCIGITHK